MGLLIILLSVILFTWSQNLIKGEPTAKDITTNININENINFKPPTTRNNDIIHLNGGNTTESTKLEAEDKVVFRNNKIVIRQAILKGDSPVSSDILTRCLGVFALSSCQADTIQVKVFNILEDQYSSKFCFSLATFFQKDYPCFEAKSTSEGIAFKSIQGNESNVESLIMPETTSMENCYVLILRSNRIQACLSWKNITWSSTKFSGCLSVRLKYYVKPLQYITVHCISLRRNDLETKVHVTHETRINLTNFLGDFGGEPDILNRPPLFSGVLDLDEPKLKVTNLECLKKEITNTDPVIFLPYEQQTNSGNIISLTQTECKSPSLLIAGTSKLPQGKETSKILIGADQLISTDDGVPSLERTRLRGHSSIYESSESKIRAEMLDSIQRIPTIYKPNLDITVIERKPKYQTLTWVPMDFITKRPHNLNPAEPQSGEFQVSPTLWPSTSSPCSGEKTCENKNIIYRDLPKSTVPGGKLFGTLENELESVRNPQIEKSQTLEEEYPFGYHMTVDRKPKEAPTTAESKILIGESSSPSLVTTIIPDKIKTSPPRSIPERENLIVKYLPERFIANESSSNNNGSIITTFRPLTHISDQLAISDKIRQQPISVQPSSSSDTEEGIRIHPPSLLNPVLRPSGSAGGMPIGEPPPSIILDGSSYTPESVSKLEGISLPSAYITEREQFIENDPSKETVPSISPSTQNGLGFDANLAPSELISGQLSSTTEHIRGSHQLDIQSEHQISDGVETVIMYQPPLSNTVQPTPASEDETSFGKSPTPQISDNISSAPDNVIGYEETTPTSHFLGNESETSCGELLNIEGKHSNKSNQQIHQQKQESSPCCICSQTQPLPERAKEKSTRILITQGNPKINNPLMHIVVNKGKPRVQRRRRPARKKSRKRRGKRHRKLRTKKRKGKKRKGWKC